MFIKFLFSNLFFFCSYEHQDIALNCGTMLRECARYEALAKIMIYSEDFYNFFRYVEVSTFDIASDAFSTFKVFFFFPPILTTINLKFNQQFFLLFIYLFIYRNY